MKSGTPSVRLMISSTVCRGKRSAARDPLHQRRTLAPVEAAEGEHRNVRLPGPWRLKLGPECNQ